MQKTSQFYLILMLAVAFFVFYEAFFPFPSPFTIGRALGLSALFLLAVTLLMGPLMHFRPKEFAPLLESRRAVGLSAFAFMAAHFLLVFIANVRGDFAPILATIELAVAVPATLIFLAMALTSSDWAVRTLGIGKWKTLHRFTYLGFVLALAHYYFMGTGILSPTAPGGFSIHFGELLVWATSGAAIVLQLAGFWASQKKKAVQQAEWKANPAFSPPAGNPSSPPASASTNLEIPKS